MARNLQSRRLTVLSVALSVAFTGLAYRLIDLQVLRHEELGRKAQQNTQQRYFIESRRGDILDVKGNILATSINVKTVCADPTLIGPRRAEVARAIAPLLQMSEADLMQRLAPRVRQNDRGESFTNQYARLKTRVPVETWVKIRSAMTNLNFGLDEKKLLRKEREFYSTLRGKSVFAEDDQMRIYPNRDLAAHVLGFATAEESNKPDGPVSEIVGREGIELFLNSKLSGTRGWRQTETDRRGRELVTAREQDVEPRDGFNVVLTIDSYVQHLAETALADVMEKHSPISATAIVGRPRTGEILALAVLPDYNPNKAGSSSPDARRNRVVSDVVEPGSTFKIVPVSGALNDNVVTLNDVFNCEHGHFAFAGRVLHDHEPSDNLTVKGIITRSSNIGAAKVGIKLGPDRLYDYIQSFGFGARSGISLPGEVPGIVHPVAKWSKVSVAQIPMGHGIAVTRMQMFMAMCAIANNGKLMRPMLVDHLEDEDGKIVARYQPQAVRQVVGANAARDMVEALKTVVAAADGTATKAAMTNYTVAGKTGTAQKVEGGQYVHGKYIASFIGFFPADNPELCISIVLDEPKEGYYGGMVAAPVFKQIAERAATYLNIEPNLPPAKSDVLARNGGTNQ
ncbi:MAG: penicillin-binding protein 2 [Verrucomicrobiota bacterium]